MGASITDSSGRTASDSIPITVEPPPPLTAVEIISSGTVGVAPATFEFEADVIGGIGPYTYSWDFGDGSVEVDDDETVEHTFDVAGTYNVDLTVIDSTGQTVSDSTSITVEEPPALVEVEEEEEEDNNLGSDDLIDLDDIIDDLLEGLGFR